MVLESHSMPDKRDKHEVSFSPEPEKTQPYITLFVGPEGSGKTTQGKMFAEMYGLPFIESGQAFRDLREENKNDPTELSKRVADLEGYAGWELFQEVMKWRFKEQIVKGEKHEEDYSKGFVLDGAPRTLQQYEHFDDLMKELGFNYPIRLVFLHIPKKESIVRLSQRDGRDETATDQSRLDLHYESLDKKINIAKEKGWGVVTIVTMTGHTKTENLVSKEIREKLGLLPPAWREVIDLGNEDLSFEEVGLDVANAVDRDKKLSRINDYLKNINDTLNETFSDGEWFKQLLRLKGHLEYQKQKLGRTNNG